MVAARGCCECGPQRARLTVRVPIRPWRASVSMGARASEALQVLPYTVMALACATEVGVFTA